MSRKHVFIIAEDFPQANTWARERDISPRYYTYVSDVERLMGLWRGDYVLVGECQKRPDFGRIMDELIIREFKEVSAA